jgi:hypothetical protein
MKKFALLLVVGISSLGWSACGQSFRDRLTATWTLQSQTCNSVNDSTIANGLAAGATITLLIEANTFRKTTQSSSCSHVRNGDYITTPGETGVSMTETGTLGCTPASCAIDSFSMSSSNCGATLSESTSPAVAFRESGRDVFMDLTFSGTDCNSDGARNDVRIETYRRVADL